MKSFLKIAIVGMIISLFVSCGGGGLSGTYLPKNDAAKQTMFSKFIFKGNKVTVITSASGIEKPESYKYPFHRIGDKITIEMETGGITMGTIVLNYNERNNELRLLYERDLKTSVYNDSPVWIREESDTHKNRVGDLFSGNFGRNNKESITGIDENKGSDFKKELQPVTDDEDAIISIEETSTSERATSSTDKSTPSQSKENEANDKRVTPKSENKSKSSLPPGVILASKPMPSIDELNYLLMRISTTDDHATDEIRSILGNRLKVEGIPNISNVQQLITDASIGTFYKITSLNTDAEGNVISITLTK